MKKLAVIMSAVVIVLCSVNTSYAYLDPGAGSMLLQVLLGGVVGLAVVLKLYWHRFLALFGIVKEKKADAESNSPD